MSSKDLGAFGIRQFANACFTKVVLAINAASAATIKTTNAATVAIDGILYSVAALAARVLTPVPGMRPLYVIPENQTSYLLVVVNSAGTAFVLQSDFLGRDLSAFGTAAKGTGEMPEAPTGYAPIGCIKIAVKPGQTFAPGVDALDNATKATVTFVDCLIAPAEF